MAAYDYLTSLKKYKAKQLLHIALKNLNIKDEEMEKSSRDMIDIMLEHNRQLSLDTLIAASLFVAIKSHRMPVTVDQINRITNNHGGKNNTSWQALVPLVKVVAQDAR